MQTPFFGLTVIFHIIVVFVHWVFIHLLHKVDKDLVPVVSTTYINIVTNALIISLVFGFVLFTAFSTVRNSINSEYSTANLVHSYLEKRGKTPSSNTLVEHITSAGGSPVLCVDLVSGWPIGTAKVLLLNYMMQSNRPYSLEDINLQAQIHGLFNYQGTVAENLWLLERLKSDDGSLGRLKPCER